MDHGGIDEYIHRIGRTGRIGHIGHATSFYSDRNEGMGPALVNVLMETEQTVPDFLEQYKPEGGVADFADDTDEEEEQDNTAGGADLNGANGDGGDAWGAATTDNTGAATANGWGAAEAPTATATPAVGAW